MKVELEATEVMSVCLLIGLLLILFSWVPSCEAESERNRKHEIHMEKLKSKEVPDE